MDLELRGKIALLTGSSRGIGLAIAQTLHDEGCTVILNGRNTSQLASAAMSMGVESMTCDLSLDGSAQALVDFVISRYGALDILVCNVGTGASLPPGQEDWPEWERMINLNLRPAVSMVHAARKHLTLSHGVALCISSICGTAALGAPLAYSAAKAALDSYVRGMARVLGPLGVRINALAPGNILFEGNRWADSQSKQPDEVQEMLCKEVALQRFGRLHEVANVAAFLCSSKSGFIAGEVLVADGGQLRG